jgi:hypothetical protein
LANHCRCPPLTPRSPSLWLDPGWVGLVSNIDAERPDIDALFAEIDSSVAMSRVLMGGEVVEWGMVESIARERGIIECPVCLAPLAAGET